MDEHPDLEPTQEPRRRAQRRTVGIGAVFAAALLGGLIGAVTVGGGMWVLDRALTTPSPGPETVATAAVATTLAMPAQPVEAAAARVLPSVVNTATEIPTRFGKSTAFGSGVIIRADGYILTNNHVIEGAATIVVRLGTTDYPATVVGTDPTSDLAVIKVAKNGLPVATFGTSASLQVGEGVVAVGSPFGLDKTVTAGIVSALHRTNLTQGQSGVTSYTNLIQTDAPINPGNSGGALADLTGAVVGINTLIISPSGQLGTSQSAGIGFAIPIDFARTIADQLVAGTKITHPYLGASTATIDELIARYYSLPVDAGALVQQVAAGSPAAEAGLKVGDIIVRIDEHVVATSEDVFIAVRGSTIGQTIRIEVVRGSERVTVDATLTSDAAVR